MIKPRSIRHKLVRVHLAKSRRCTGCRLFHPPWRVLDRVADWCLDVGSLSGASCTGLKIMECALSRKEYCSADDNFQKTSLAGYDCHGSLLHLNGGSSRTTNEFAPSEQAKTPTHIAPYSLSFEVQICKVAIFRRILKYYHRSGKICRSGADF